MEQWVNISIIAVYMVAVIGVGFFFAKKDETTENYLLGGRNMPYIAVGLSMMMTLLSSISIVMIPGEIFNYGMTVFSLNILTCAMGIPYYLLFVRFYFKLGSFTPYEYLERRYDHTVRAVVAVSAFYSRIMYLGMVLYASSKIFQAAYGWPCWFTILLVGAIGMVYTVMGGMKAVIWTDVIQFFVLAGGTIFILLVLNSNLDGGLIGGMIYAFENGHGAPQYATREFYTITPYIRLCFWLLLWNSLFSSMGAVSSDQLNIQRILTTKDWKTGFKSQCISSGLGLVNTIVLFMVGFAIYAYYAQNPDPALSGDGDMAFFHFIATKTPTPIPGIFMAAMLAAIMSTLDSGMNSMSTVWLKEIHAKFINKKMTPAKEVSVSRWATFLVGAFAILLGLGLDLSGRWLSQSITEVGTIFNMLGAATAPAFLFAVLSKRANSLLIWAYTFFAAGEAIGKNIWYALSRTAVQNWEKNPEIGFGWGGKLDAVYMLVPVIAGILLCLPYLGKKLRTHLSVKITAMIGMLILGIGFTNFLWWAYSNACVTTEPLACSFAFGLPCSLIVAFVILWFCPVQPEKKWRGLTIATVGQEMISEN
ncbi:MAG: sodium/solute symporter [Lentisphaerae bacterium]|nr:sodium/solute symporter [Lentisphaerota bacterium]